MVFQSRCDQDEIVLKPPRKIHQNEFVLNLSQRKRRKKITTKNEGCLISFPYFPLLTFYKLLFFPFKLKIISTRNFFSPFL